MSEKIGKLHPAKDEKSPICHVVVEHSYTNFLWQPSTIKGKTMGLILLIIDHFTDTWFFDVPSVHQMRVVTHFPSRSLMKARNVLGVSCGVRVEIFYQE